MNKKPTVVLVNGIKKIYYPVESSLNSPSGVKHKKKKDTATKEQCLGCYKGVYLIASSANGHPGYCSKKCMNLGKRKRKGIRWKERNLSPSQKRQARQLRRQEKQKNPAIDFYWSDAWREIRFKILRKYGFSCMACGRSTAKDKVKMHVDHIKPRSKYPELELDPNNLQVLCEDCNIGKNNYSEEDLRP